MSDTTHTITADIVVVGLGAWGSQALWRLAARGIDVVGIERYGIGHSMGSTHGTTRLFRIACLEHPGLAPIAIRSRDLWNELGDAVGETLLRQTGGIMVGPRHGHVVAGTLAAADAAGLDVDLLDHDQLLERFPQYGDFGPDDIGVWDPAAGVSYPEAGVRAAVSEAERLGARVLSDTRVTDVELINDGVLVSAGALRIHAKQVVLAAGAWMPKFVDYPLAARRTPLFWFDSTDENATLPGGDFDLDAFPVFIRELPDGSVLWGHGARKDGDDHFSVKIGMEDRGDNFSDTDADTVDRYIHPDTDFGQLSELVSRAFPTLDSTPTKAISCMVTNSADGQFLVGRPDDDPRLIIAGGDSGHGFKHAPGVGELLAQIAVGERPFTDIGFLDPNRSFAGGSSWQVGNALAASAAR